MVKQENLLLEWGLPVSGVLKYRPPNPEIKMQPKDRLENSYERPPIPYKLRNNNLTNDSSIIYINMMTFNVIYTLLTFLVNDMKVKHKNCIFSFCQNKHGDLTLAFRVSRKAGTSISAISSIESFLLFGINGLPVFHSALVQVSKFEQVTNDFKSFIETIRAKAFRVERTTT